MRVRVCVVVNDLEHLRVTDEGFANSKRCLGLKAVQLVPLFHSINDACVWRVNFATAERHCELNMNKFQSHDQIHHSSFFLLPSRPKALNSREVGTAMVLVDWACEGIQECISSLKQCITLNSYLICFLYTLLFPFSFYIS